MNPQAISALTGAPLWVFLIEIALALLLLVSYLVLPFLVMAIRERMASIDVRQKRVEELLVRVVEAETQVHVDLLVILSLVKPRVTPPPSMAVPQVLPPTD